MTFPRIWCIIYFVHKSKTKYAPIAQLDRVFDYESKGHRFESCWVHHKPPTSLALSAVVFYLCFMSSFYFKQSTPLLSFDTESPRVGFYMQNPFFSIHGFTYSKNGSLPCFLLINLVFLYIIHHILFISRIIISAAFIYKGVFL